MDQDTFKKATETKNKIEALNKLYLSVLNTTCIILKNPTKDRTIEIHSNPELRTAEQAIAKEFKDKLLEYITIDKQNQEAYFKSL